MNDALRSQLAIAATRWRAGAEFLLAARLDPGTIRTRFPIRRWRLAPMACLSVARHGDFGNRVGLLGLAAACPAGREAGLALSKPSLTFDGAPEVVAISWRLVHAPTGRHDLPALALALGATLEEATTLVQAADHGRDRKK